MLANHQCVWCTVFESLSLVLLHFYLLFSSLHMWNSGIYLFLLSLCCIFCCPRLSSVLPCLVRPRHMTRLCFVLRPCKLLNISPSMFEYCVLWEEKCAIGWPRKARCIMQRKVLVSLVSTIYDLDFWPTQFCSNSGTWSLLPCVPGGYHHEHTSATAVAATWQ